MTFAKTIYKNIAKTLKHVYLLAPVAKLMVEIYEAPLVSIEITSLHRLLKFLKILITIYFKISTYLTEMKMPLTYLRMITHAVY